MYVDILLRVTVLIRLYRRRTDFGPNDRDLRHFPKSTLETLEYHSDYLIPPSWHWHESRLLTTLRPPRIRAIPGQSMASPNHLPCLDIGIVLDPRTPSTTIVLQKFEKIWSSEKTKEQ